MCFDKLKRIIFFGYIDEMTIVVENSHTQVKNSHVESPNSNLDHDVQHNIFNVFVS
jgi:hypothetical protein